jgi:hypothetical protein
MSSGEIFAAADSEGWRRERSGVEAAKRGGRQVLASGHVVLRAMLNYRMCEPGLAWRLAL